LIAHVQLCTLICVRLAAGFPKEVRQLTTRMRNVLMATAQMREHNHEPEVLNELQLNLADSYSCTPELRVTWLQALAEHHAKAGAYSEAASCHLHMAALHAEYLRQKGLLQWGADAFADISPNITRDEQNLKVDAGNFFLLHWGVTLTLCAQARLSRSSRRRRCASS
jgi:dedicator of cytokinesis protein 9/10/11